MRTCAGMRRDPDATLESDVDSPQPSAPQPPWLRPLRTVRDSPAVATSEAAVLGAGRSTRSAPARQLADGDHAEVHQNTAREKAAFARVKSAPAQRPRRHGEGLQAPEAARSAEVSLGCGGAMAAVMTVADAASAPAVGSKWDGAGQAAALPQPDLAAGPGIASADSPEGGEGSPTPGTNDSGSPYSRTEGERFLTANGSALDPALFYIDLTQDSEDLAAEAAYMAALTQHGVKPDPDPAEAANSSLEEQRTRAVSSPCADEQHCDPTRQSAFWCTSAVNQGLNYSSGLMHMLSNSFKAGCLRHMMAKLPQWHITMQCRVCSAGFGTGAPYMARSNAFEAPHLPCRRMQLSRFKSSAALRGKRDTRLQLQTIARSLRQRCRLGLSTKSAHQVTCSTQVCTAWTSTLRQAHCCIQAQNTFEGWCSSQTW